MTYIPIPKEGVSLELRAEVEAQLPEPLVFPGWKFTGYHWPKLSQIKTKDEVGNTDNSVRLGGTGVANESLPATLAKGIDITKHTMSVRNLLDLNNGFNRLKELLNQGYEEWPVANYEPDPSTRTEFQDSLYDCLQDLRRTSNRDAGAKPITDDEILEGLIERFEERKKDRDQMVKYITLLDLNLTDRKIKGLVTTALRRFERRGNVESYTREQAEEYLDSLGGGWDLVNTRDTTRVLRMWTRIMDNYVKNEIPLDLAAFNTGATSHQMIDENLEETMEELVALDELTLKYAAVRNKLLYTDSELNPWNWVGQIPQKIRNNAAYVWGKVKGLVEI